ncbi:MAG: bifunctional phosphoribosylaminoimidazolecarboxamide formyltransferase/IMP cyclohydrolase, partial [Candidatus Dormibacteria bacterium]
MLGVSDRTGLSAFAQGLRSRGYELVATDGTRAALAADGIPAVAVADVTGFPEILGGRVKTLHPAIHAGILARRDLPDHMRQLEQRGFSPIDLVAVSLYPFEQVVERGASDAEIVENIDIGGPALIRAAAKNGDAVTVVVSPAQYDGVLTEMATDGGVSSETRRCLAAEALAHVAAYDTAVAHNLRSRCHTPGMPAALTVGGPLLQQLRYGENPHQSGGLYRVPGRTAGVANASRLHGPELSFTNWLDVDTAWRIVAEFDEPAAVIVKHSNPCGFAIGEDAADAYRRAFECDPRSAFGGVVALNGMLDSAVAAELSATFLEAVVTSGTTNDALDLVRSRQRLRVLAVTPNSTGSQLDVRSIDGGLLAQTVDRTATDTS